MPVTLDNDTIKNYVQASAETNAYARAQKEDLIELAKNAAIEEVTVRLGTDVEDNARNQMLGTHVAFLFLSLGDENLVEELDRIFTSYGWVPKLD